MQNTTLVSLQFGNALSLSFREWMQRQSELYHLLRCMDVSERQTSPELLLNYIRYLVSKSTGGDTGSPDTGFGEDDFGYRRSGVTRHVFL